MIGVLCVAFNPKKERMISVDRADGYVRMWPKHGSGYSRPNVTTVASFSRWRRSSSCFNSLRLAATHHSGNRTPPKDGPCGLDQSLIRGNRSYSCERSSLFPRRDIQEGEPGLERVCDMYAKASSYHRCICSLSDSRSVTVGVRLRSLLGTTAPRTPGRASIYVSTAVHR